MKKILGLTILLTLAASCTNGPATNTSTANVNNAAAAKSPPSVTEADITAREKATWEALKKKDYPGFGELLANDYLEVGGEGVYDKQGIINNVKDLTLSDVTFSDWKMIPVDKDTALLTYQVTIKGANKNQEIPPGPYRAGAVWQNRDGKWVVVYYQETLAAAPPTGAAQPSPPAKSAAPAASAKPAAASTPAVTGPDPEANEKMVWDALKSKNYDQFASYLAPESIEVEPDGVFDKSGSVKGVSSVDLSKAQLSEWKSLKIDPDAAVVTYLVTQLGSKSPKERHSTVWINRDGKWLALYHQGTKVEGMAPAPSPKSGAPK